MKIHHGPAAITLPLLFLVLWASVAHAVDKTYVGGSNDWSSDASWDPPGVPGSMDDVTISSGTVTLNAPANVATLTLNGGTLTGSGTLDVSGTLTWSGGVMRGSGTTNANGGLELANTSALFLQDTRTLNNAQVANWSGTTISALASTSFNNAAGATFNIQTAATFSGGNLDNAGTVNKESGGGDGVTRITSAFNNTGTVNVNGGTLRLEGGSTQSGTLAVDNATALHFAGGTHNVTGGSLGGAGSVDFMVGAVNITGGTYGITGITRVSSGTLDYSVGSPMPVTTYMQIGGTLTGSGTLDVSGTLTWSGGVMRGSGTTNANGGLELANTSALFLQDTRTLNNAQVANWSGTTISALASTSFNNAAGATFNIQTAATFSGGNLDNAGTVNKESGGGDGVTRITSAFNNTGTVNVNGGTLRLEGGSTQSGTLAVDNATALHFAGGTHNVTGGSLGGAGSVDFMVGAVNITGGTYGITGTTRVSSGTLDYSVGSPMPVTTYMQIGGTLTGSGTLDVSGTLTWSGGVMRGSGTTNANGGLELANTSALFLQDTRTLNNAQVANWSGTTISALASTSFNNAAGATFNIQTAATFSGGNLDNAGTVNKESGGGDGVTRITSAFNNTGTVNVNGGTLRLEGGSTQSGTLAVDNATALHFAGGTHNVTGGSLGGAGSVDFMVGAVNITGGTYGITGITRVSSGTLDYSVGSPMPVTTYMQIGGTLTGSGTLDVSGTLTWSGGVMRGSGTTNANGGLELANASALFLQDTRTLNNAQVANWSGTTISAAASTSFNNAAGATFNIQTAATFSGGNLDNAGTVNKESGGGDGVTRITSAFNNTGTVNVNGGTLSLQGGYVQSAGATRLSGGELQSLQTININGGTLEGSGNVGANVSSDGNVSPGLSAGLIEISGTYNQRNGGAFSIEIGGSEAGTGFDRVEISGAATLDGNINAQLIDAFEPNLGDRFEVMAFDSRTGDFSSEDLVVGGGRGFRKTVTDTNVILEFVREICDDAGDNDGDGLIDCADPKCADASPCSPTPPTGVPGTPTSTVMGTATSTATETATAIPTATPTDTPTDAPGTATSTPTSTPTDTATPTPTDTPTTTPTSVATPTPSPTGMSDQIKFTGILLAPGRTGPQGPSGVGAVPDNAVELFACNTRRACLRLPSEPIDETVTDETGMYMFLVPADFIPRQVLLIVRAFVDGSECRFLITPTRLAELAGIGVAAGGGSGLPANVAPLDPITEGAVRLLDIEGLENYDDAGIDGVFEAVEEANSDTDFENLTVAQANDLAETIAAEDPTVQMVLEDSKVGVCASDCNGNRIVAINELVIGVNIAVGILPLEGCPASDADGDGNLTVAELVGGVQNALEGCD